MNTLKMLSLEKLYYKLKIKILILKLKLKETNKYV